MTKLLIGIAFSPWSEKAKWALSHHHIEYRYEEYVPLIGELMLRLRLHRPTGMVTVPVLRDGALWLTDSLDIAKHADRIGRGATLFPPHAIAEIERWNECSERALSAGRALAMIAAASDPRTARAMVPKPLRALLTPIAKKGLERFVEKYRMREDADRHEQRLGEELGKLEAALQNGSGHLIGDTLSYADITMAAAVQLVVPVDASYMPSAPRGVTWKPNRARAERFARLVAWRDDLYAKHRRAK